LVSKKSSRQSGHVNGSGRATGSTAFLSAYRVGTGRVDGSVTQKASRSDLVISVQQTHHITSLQYCVGFLKYTTFFQQQPSSQLRCNHQLTIDNNWLLTHDISTELCMSQLSFNKLTVLVVLSKSIVLGQTLIRSVISFNNQSDQYIPRTLLPFNHRVCSLMFVRSTIESGSGICTPSLQPCRLERLSSFQVNVSSWLSEFIDNKSTKLSLLSADSFPLTNSNT
jgi:hypothetical protein